MKSNNSYMRVCPRCDVIHRVTSRNSRICDNCNRIKNFKKEKQNV